MKYLLKKTNAKGKTKAVIKNKKQMIKAAKKILDKGGSMEASKI